MCKFVYFGSSKISEFVLDELRKAGLEPVLTVTSAREAIDLDKFREINADVFVVASFGKILPAELIYMPKHKTLNMHPSLLPRLRGPAPIQGAIMGEKETGITIMRMDERMDHGPIIAQEKVAITPWPDYYRAVEERLGRAGGKLLAEVLPKWIKGELQEVEQDESAATYTKLIRKEDADISTDSPEHAYKKILAYEVWPRARKGDLIITHAHLDGGELVIDRVLPPGKKEMLYADYLRGRH